MNPKNKNHKNKKRVRNANFTSEEKMKLLNLCVKAFNIIENKKTDQVTNNIKNEKWLEISASFNSNFASAERTVVQLQNKYNEMKKELKKKLRKENEGCFETDGRSIIPVYLTPDEQELAKIVLLGINGLSTTFYYDPDPDLETYDANPSGNEEVESLTPIRNRKRKIEDLAKVIEESDQKPRWNGYIQHKLFEPISQELQVYHFLDDVNDFDTTPNNENNDEEISNLSNDDHETDNCDSEKYENYESTSKSCKPSQSKISFISEKGKKQFEELAEERLEAIRTANKNSEYNIKIATEEHEMKMKLLNAQVNQVEVETELKTKLLKAQLDKVLLEISILKKENSNQD